MSKKAFNITPLASASRTATGNQTITNWPANFDEVTGYLIVTAVTGASPTLDVVYQTSPDEGTTWFTHTSFTQATAATTERKVITQAGNYGRILYTIGGTTPDFTFSFILEGKKHG